MCTHIFIDTNTYSNMITHIHVNIKQHKFAPSMADKELRSDLKEFPYKRQTHAQRRLTTNTIPHRQVLRWCNGEEQRLGGPEFEFNSAQSKSSFAVCFFQVNYVLWIVRNVSLCEWVNCRTVLPNFHLSLSLSHTHTHHMVHHTNQQRQQQRTKRSM